MLRLMLLCLLTLAPFGGPGTAAAQTTAGLPEITLRNQGVRRSYYVHVPAALASGSGHPAIIVFHGGEGTGLDAASSSNMAAAADQGGFIAVFPNSNNDQWNDGRNTTASRIDDVAFTMAVIADLGTRYGVNPARVFAVGESNGGMFTQRLACDAANSFVGFGIVAANMPTDYAPRCAPARPIPMMFFNGTADPIMPFGGGEISSSGWAGAGVGGTVKSHSDTMAFWSAINGCTQITGPTTLPARVNDGTSVQREQLQGCNGAGRMEIYIITGGGHTWPGSPVTPNTAVVGVLSQQIDATAELVAYFKVLGL